MAQTATQTNGVSRTNMTVPLVPLPPNPPKSPVELFRELLAMSPMERQKFLEGRSPENKRLILAKVREYLALNPNDRALRLEVTELRWYLLPLLKNPPAPGDPRLEAMPPDMRKLVQDRLQIWQIVPPNLQRELLENEAAARVMIEMPAQNAAQQWQQWDEQKREELKGLFDTFFGLREYEQTKVLSKLSNQEYRQLETTLLTYRNLAPTQRARCIHSFSTFASFSPEERAQFLHKAEKWKEMTPKDREAWRKIVEQESLKPLLPISNPPLPPSSPPGSRISTAVATNSN